MIARSKQCAICARPLTVHQAVRGATCDDAGCRWKQVRASWPGWSHLREPYGVVLAAERRLERRIQRLRRTALAARGESDASKLPHGIVPSNPRRIVNLPAARIRSFRDRLERLVSEAAARMAADGEPPAAPAVSDATPDQTAVLAGGCALCRGHCCRRGEDHAFLKVETIQRFLATHPEASPWQVLASYLEHLPRRSYAGSCVYHTRTGCALPRTMRAEICNTWYCGGLLLLQLRLEAGPDARAFAVAVDGQDRVLRAAVLDRAGMHPIPSHARDKKSVSVGAPKGQNGRRSTRGLRGTDAPREHMS